MKRLEIRQWRVFGVEPSGVAVWFDPVRELVRLYEKEPLPEGGVAVAQEGEELSEVSSSDITQVVLDFEDLPF